MKGALTNNGGRETSSTGPLKKKFTQPLFFSCFSGGIQKAETKTNSFSRTRSLKHWRARNFLKKISACPAFGKTSASRTDENPIAPAQPAEMWFSNFPLGGVFVEEAKNLFGFWLHLLDVWLRQTKTHLSERRFLLSCRNFLTIKNASFSAGAKSAKTIRTISKWGFAPNPNSLRHRNNLGFLRNGLSWRP
jgi:hypothetical protein